MGHCRAGRENGDNLLGHHCRADRQNGDNLSGHCRSGRQIKITICCRAGRQMHNCLLGHCEAGTKNYNLLSHYKQIEEEKMVPIYCGSTGQVDKNVVTVYCRIATR